MPPKAGLGSGKGKRKSADPDDEIDYDEDSLEQPSKKQHTPEDRRHTAPAAKGLLGHERTGYITRIRMKNILSYEDVEVEPGRELNLIVGPNGSGKSTIVDAICLSLGGGAKIVDRFKDEFGFVMRGKSEGMVEIWLNQGAMKDDLCIKRVINKETRKITCFINGRSVGQKDVNAIVAKNNIKLDSLCHFLPQEKVKKLSESVSQPHSFLLDIEEAVGPAWMRPLHDELIEEQGRRATLMQDQDACQKELSSLRSRAQALQQEMELFDRQSKLRKEKEIREKKLPYLKVQKVKRDRKAKQEEYDALQPEVKRLSEDAQEKKQMFVQQEKLASKSKEASDKFKLQAKKIMEEINRLDDKDQELCTDGDQMQHTLKTIDKKVQKLGQDIRKKESELEQLRIQLENAGPPPEGIDRQIKEATAEYRAATEKVNQMMKKVREASDKEKENKLAIVGRQKAMERFKDVKTERMNRLKHDNYGAARSSYNMRLWLDRNRDQFEKEVYGPLFLELEVENAQDSRMVDAALGTNAYRFLCQTQKDFDTFHKLMTTDKEMGRIANHVNLVNASKVKRWAPTGEKIEDLKRFGVDGFLIDRVKAPAVVLDAVCELCGFHRIMYSSSDKVWDDYIDIGKNESLITRDAGNKKHSRIAGAGFYTPKGCVRITYSLYGNQQVNPSRTLYKHFDGSKVTPGNSEEKQRILSELEALKRESEELGGKVQELQGQERAARSKADALHGEMQSLKEQKDGTKAISAKIKHAEDTLGRLKKEKPDKDRPKLEKQIAELIGRRLENVEKVNGFSRKLFEARRAAFVNELKALSVAEEIQKHKDAALAAAQLANEALGRLNIIAQELEVLKELYADAKSKCQPLSDEDKEEIPHLSDDVDVLEAEIESRSVEIQSLGVQTDRRREFEQTNARIAVLDDKLGNGQGIMEAHQAKLDAMKTRLLDGDGEDVGLRQLCQKVNEIFTTMMADMGNAGEVQLEEAKKGDDDDFENYGLKIFVMFRGESQGGGNLIQYKGQRFSGGEQGVTVMLFLIALQQFAPCPFRVIDEINQGMDAHNEKAIFDNLVKYNCKSESTCQIFLITPKLQGDLLSNMKDHLTVLCVFRGKHNLPSGPWVRGGMLHEPLEVN